MWFNSGHKKIFKVFIFLYYMKKIVTKDMKKKQDRRNQLIIGIILIGLMLFSTVGFALNGSDDESSENVVEYNGIEFRVAESGYWNFVIQGFEFNVLHNPLEVEDINFLNLKSLPDYQDKPLYFVGESQEGISELARNLNYFVSRINSACLDEDNCEGDYPIKNCSVDNVIVIEEIEEGEREQIIQEENCIFVSSSLRNETRYADALLFDLIGVR